MRNGLDNGLGDHHLQYLSYKKHDQLPCLIARSFVELGSIYRCVSVSGNGIKMNSPQCVEVLGYHSPVGSFWIPLVNIIKYMGR